MIEDRELNEQIGNIFRKIFQARPEEISDSTQRGVLERWDSLGHLDLIATLSEGFDIEISPEEALEIETIADIKRLVKKLRMAKESR